MIPKKIHYCWFGGSKLPALEARCIDSWKKLMPDYEIKLWDENNFDIETNQFVKEAYEKKKYAFVSDYVRFDVLYKEGGIYLDTDVELLKSLDNFIVFEAFGSFETENLIQTGVIGSIAKGRLSQKMLAYYEEKKFIYENEHLNMLPNSRILTDILLNHGLILNNQIQDLSLFKVYSSDYFCCIDQATREVKITENSYCIHYLAGSWLPNKDKLTRGFKKFIGNLFGYTIVSKLRSIIKSYKRDYLSKL